MDIVTKENINDVCKSILVAYGLVNAHEVSDKKVLTIIENRRSGTCRKRMAGPNTHHLTMSINGTVSDSIAIHMNGNWKPNMALLLIRDALADDELLKEVSVNVEIARR